jgi:MFS family permease
MKSIASSPGAARVLVLSIVARLPLTMLSLGLLVHVLHLTGSFAAAGAVDGAYAISLGVGGPVLGKLIDRRRQSPVLAATAVVAAALMAAIAVMPAGAPLPALLALATALGVATPPVGACVRALFPALLDDAEALRAAYAVEASGVELTWILGPPLVLALGILWSTGAALAVAALVLLAATAAFAAQPASRAWRPAAGAARPRGGAMGSPAMRTLVGALVAVGILTSAVQVGVTAAADALGSAAAAGPLVGIWGAGSLVGGLVAVRLGGGAYSAAGLAAVLAALTLGHLLLVAAAGSALAIAAVLLLGGAAIAPTFATVFGMVERAAPEGTVTEAFAWLSTASAAGSAAGAAVAGLIADHSGPVAAFGLAAGAGAVAVAMTLLRAETLRRQPAALLCNA